MIDFKLEYLDHVAIRVKDIDTSVKWYHDILGLKKYIFKEWGDYPVFMMSGSSGIAIFPADISVDLLPKKYMGRYIEHFAFNVSIDSFKKVQNHLSELNMKYRFMDHVHFHSIYFKDPDDHEVELTTSVSANPFV